MSITPLPPHAIATDHPASPGLQWTREELAWIAGRDKQFLVYATKVRTDLEEEIARLRDSLSDLYRSINSCVDLTPEPLRRVSNVLENTK